MYWRRFAVADIPLDDQSEFDAWIRARWAEKDQLLDECFETGRFPTELGGSIVVGTDTPEQTSAAATGYAETQVRLGHWTELGRIFMVLVGTALLCRLPRLFGLF